MQDGGCHAEATARPADELRFGRFRGAKFGFLAANVVREDTGKPLFAALRDQEVRRRQGRLHRHDARGHAGHRHAPPASPASDFLDEAETANALRARAARRHGVKAIVVLLHEGGVADAVRRHQRVQRARRPDRQDIVERTHRRGRPVRHGPHPPAVQLRDRRRARSRARARSAAWSPTSTSRSAARTARRRRRSRPTTRSSRAT